MHWSGSLKQFGFTNGCSSTLRSCATVQLFDNLHLAVFPNHDSKNHGRAAIQEMESPIRRHSSNWRVQQEIHRNRQHSFQESSSRWEHRETTFWNIWFSRCNSNYWVFRRAISLDVWIRVLYFCVIPDSTLQHACYSIWRTDDRQFLVRLNQHFNRRMHERTHLLSPLALPYRDNSSVRRKARYQSFGDVARVSDYIIDIKFFQNIAMYSK